MNAVLNEKEKLIRELQRQVDAASSAEKQGQQILSELKVQYPEIESGIIQPAADFGEAAPRKTWIAIIRSNKVIGGKDRKTMGEWLKVRINTDAISVYFEETPGKREYLSQIKKTDE